jgi:plasmid stabilization system protein ParE
MRVVISGQAEADLARIFAWLATGYDLQAAEGFRLRAEDALAQLGQHPGLGPHPGWATRHQKLRFWVISRTRYVIYYEWEAECVSIERVLDGRRDVRRIIEFGVEDPPADPEQD